MPSLLFERDTELIVSDLQDDDTVIIRHRNFAEDATNIDESTALDIEEIERLAEWLRQQAYTYEDRKIKQKGKVENTTG